MSSVSQSIRRLHGDQPLDAGLRVVRLLETRQEPVGTGTGFIYVYVVLVEEDAGPGE